MKIFITGSTGFIGQNLVEFYHDQEVLAYTRDLDIRYQLEKFQPNLIINCAAEIYNPENMWYPNILITVACLDYVKCNSETSMVQIGSSSEYGPVSRATKETDVINPVDMYQATKGAATLLCQGYARTYKRNIKIARPYSVYGRYEKPHRLFPRLWRAFQNNVPMKLFHGYHDFIHVDDFVRGIDILYRTHTEDFGDIVNFGSGKQYSNLEVYNLFIEATGKNAPVEIQEHMIKEFESEVWVCDTTYAKQKYQFEVAYDLKLGIKEFLQTGKY